MACDAVAQVGWSLPSLALSVADEAAPPPPALGWWPMDRLHPYAPDIARGNQGYAPRVEVRPGAWGVARAMSSTDHVIGIDPPPWDGVAGLTVEAWVEGGDDAAVIVSAAPIFTLSRAETRLRLDDVDCVARDGMPSDGWYHIAATWDGAMLTLWRDGMARTEAPCAGRLGEADAASLGGIFGGRAFGGTLGAVRISPRALAPDAFLGPPLEWRVRP